MQLNSACMLTCQKNLTVIKLGVFLIFLFVSSTRRQNGANNKDLIMKH